MTTRRLVLATFSAIGLALVLLWLASLTQAQPPPSPTAVPDAAAAPQAGHLRAPPSQAAPRDRFSVAPLPLNLSPQQVPTTLSPPYVVRPTPAVRRSSLVAVPEADAVFLRANAGGDWVDGQTSPDATVWITATDSGATLKGTSTTVAGSDGWFSTDLWLAGERTDLLPGDVVTVRSSDGAEGSGTLVTIEGELDVAGDSVFGQMSDGVFPANGHVDLWQRSTGDWFGWDLGIEADGTFNRNLSDQVDVQPGDYVEVWYYDEEGDWLGTLFFTLYLQANVQRTHNWVDGEAWPYVMVNVDILDGEGTYKGGGESWTGGGTWFHVNPQWPDGSGLDIETGDTVIVSAPGINATLPVIGLEAAVDSVSDIISGHIPDAVSYPAAGAVEVWDTPTGYSQGFETDGDGNFNVDLTGSYDLSTGTQVAIWYTRPDGHRIGIVRSEFRLYPFLTDDWVGEATAPNAFVEISVSDGGPLQAVKGTASGWSDAEGGFGVQPTLDGAVADILPGDVVLATSNGQSASFAIPEPFTATYDYEANTISGQAPPGSTLYVWIDGYEGFWITVPGSGGWLVDYNPYGDPQIWDQGHVNCYGGDGHVARLDLRIPLPDLSLEKWVEGNNQAAPGGPSVFNIRYRNEGSADTGTIVVTDTLPADVTYVGDTSGVIPSSGPGWVAWTMPGLAPGEEMQFQLVLSNSAGPDDTLINQADIWTQDDYNNGNNHAEAEVYVIEDQPDLYANKFATPGDPAPGQTFLWEITYGNGRPVPAGPVVLTDTFPAGTSFVSWYSEGRYSLWEEVETTDRLVLSAPAIPAGWGDRIILRLQVDPDAEFGTQLTNRIEISAPDDANPEDNWQEQDAWVSPPRWDAGIYKYFDWGQLAPGGEAGYDVHLQNYGNMPASVVVTDTLPAGTHFTDAWVWVGPDYVPFPPTYIDDEVAVWEVEMQPGAWLSFDDLRLAIGDDTPPGTVLTNCMAVAVAADSYPDNDTSCAAEVVRASGPNLRVHKNVWWTWQGQLEYEIRMENVGTETLEGFEITDQYPEGTGWHGDWWVRWGPSMDVTHDEPNRELIFQVESLGPGGTGGIGFRVDLDGALIDEQGLAFTNTVQAPIVGDVYPADNEALATAYTGPDLYAEKWISDGEPRPGEVLTFTVRAGNANRWPWEMSGGTNLVLVERLPAGMSFVSAVWPDGSPVEPFFYDADSGLLIWNFGQLGSEDGRWFYLTVGLSASLEGGDELLNQLEVLEWPAVDIDPVPSNNTFALPMMVLGPKFEVGKVHDSSRVAGTVVTYTLSVENIGTEAATNVLLSDTLPAGLTYGGGGSIADGDLTWTLTSLAPGETEIRWFWGTLSCTAGTEVENEHYRVVSSDQGVTTPDGALVSLTTVAPALVAAFTQSASQVLTGEPVLFADASTTDGTGITAWAWNWGDGAAGSGPTPSHAYSAPGSYDVALTIQDACGFSQSVMVPDAVTVGSHRILLPIILREQ